MARSLSKEWVARIFVWVVVIGIGITAFFTRETWMAWINPPETAKQESEEEPTKPVEEPTILKLTSQARKNMNLVAKPAKLQNYWKVVSIPGVVVDKHGMSDRGVTAPAIGIVSKIHAFEGNTVKAGDPLFTLTLYSEYLQNAQSELFKSVNEIQLLNEEKNRLNDLAKEGTIPRNRIIELDQQIRRQEILKLASQKELLARGLKEELFEKIEQGEFITSIQIVAPSPAEKENTPSEFEPIGFLEEDSKNQFVFELKELKIELGQQVQAGELLCVLSNHGSLYIEGHAFKQEAPMLERAAQNSWPIQVEFTEDDSQHWPNLEQSFTIRHLANTIDPHSRTFNFYISLNNQSRTYEKDENTFVVWRYRPGQRVRLRVPVEELHDVYVLPTNAFVREGPETYVFRQNGDFFNRIPVHVLYEDRQNVVIADDGSLASSFYLAQSNAASLNRVLKSQAASGVRNDIHVHADGTVHVGGH